MWLLMLLAICQNSKISNSQNLEVTFQHPFATIISMTQSMDQCGRRDPSPTNQVNSKVTSTQHSSLSINQLNFWKQFSISQVYLRYMGRVFVPKDADIWRQILYECHASSSSSHPRKTYAHGKQHFFQSGLHKDVHDHIIKCKKCQVNRAKHLKVGGTFATIIYFSWNIGQYAYKFHCKVMYY